MIPNAPEIGKLLFIICFWICAIFLPVWLVSWAVGVLLPMLLEQGSPSMAMTATAETLRALTPIISVMVFIPINAMFMVLYERRALALFTVRLGPNRVGPDGLLQTAADAVKLLFKEDITPRGADAFMFTLAPIIFFAPSIFGALPLLAAITNNHSLYQITNLPTGIFYILAAASLPVVALVMAGWSSNNKYSLVGGLRAAAQAISYEIPLVLSLVTVCLMAGSLDVVKIAQQQDGGILNWNIAGGGALRGLDKAIQTKLGVETTPLITPQQSSDPTETPVAAPTTFEEVIHQYYPFEFLSYISAGVLIFCSFILLGLYLTGACAEINRIPFDLPEAESELVSGYNTEYSGIKFAIFFLAEFTNLFIVSSIATVMFLGGGDNPIPQWLLNKMPLEPIQKSLGAILSPFINGLHLIDPDTFWAAFWVIFKVYTFVFIAILIRGTLPRFRIDQLMDFGWKRLVPLSLIAFLVVVFARVLVVCHG
ncbi:MAG: NADH-quinone oxidoreductase subunit H [Candidatus Obscuribacterales bacterium]|nr:NADH-quinone oxidoreductase subunit H [Candidatus Obscuribacterales bacterium]